MLTRYRLHLGLVVAAGLAGLLLAYADVGHHLPLAVAFAALVIIVLAGVVAAVIQFSSLRAEGRGFWRSVGSMLWSGIRTVFFFLF